MESPTQKHLLEDKEPNLPCRLLPGMQLSSRQAEDGSLMQCLLQSLDAELRTKVRSAAVYTADGQIQPSNNMSRAADMGGNISATTLLILHISCSLVGQEWESHLHNEKKLRHVLGRRRSKFLLIFVEKRAFKSCNHGTSKCNCTGCNDYEIYICLALETATTVRDNLQVQMVYMEAIFRHHWCVITTFKDNDRGVCLISSM